jgi:hypothetical protein
MEKIFCCMAAICKNNLGSGLGNRKHILARGQVDEDKNVMVHAWLCISLFAIR